MSVDTAERFFALLAIIAAAGAVLIVVLRVVPTGRRVLVELSPLAVWLAWLVAATSMGGSLYFSESVGLEPCHLCWYQRIAMYSLAVVLLVGAIRRDRSVRAYGIALAGIGIVISIYHRLIEAHPSWEASGTCSITVPCSAAPFHVFGFFTLSAMAMCGFVAILALLTCVPAQDAA